MKPSGSFPPVAEPPRLPAGPRRSVFVTGLAWCIVSVSAVGCLVSMASLLMILGGGHGTANAGLLEGFVVVGLPPITLIAGIGLLRRWRWAYGYVLALLGCIAAWNVAQMIRGSTPQHTYTSSSGVPTTVLATHVNYPVHLALTAFSLGLLAQLLTSPARSEFRHSRH